MVKKILDLINRNFNAIRRVMADLTENQVKNVTAAVGEKRAAPDSQQEQQKSKKKKKPHIVTLGKEEGFKRKVALLVAYNGAGYYGVQVNRGYRTIESDLFSALVKAETVPQEHVDNLTKMWFQRGSRTDKGVSAAGQTFSLKLKIVPEMVAKLNEHLPEQIRVLGYRRTTNGFDAKNFCCGRTYMYLTPTFAFAPLEKFITDEYRTTEDRLEHVRNILKKYLGTHKFHNFTSGVKRFEAKASRYIISFECSEPFISEGIEFVKLKVKGQSFMLHQIRKMIGLTIAILRGYCGESALTKSWEAERVDIPKAPGLGLVLEALHFDGYNKKFGSDGVHDPIEWSAEEESMETFKEKYIITDIIQQEKKDRVMFNWLQTLQFHNFDETRTEGPQKPWVKTEKLLLNKSDSDAPILEGAINVKTNETVGDEANGNTDENKILIEGTETQIAHKVEKDTENEIATTLNTSKVPKETDDVTYLSLSSDDSKSKSIDENTTHTTSSEVESPILLNTSESVLAQEKGN